MNSEVFRKFIPEIVPLLDSESVSEININGPCHVYADNIRQEIFLASRGLTRACELIAFEMNNVTLGPANPIVDTRLADGSRVAIMIPPASVDGITLTIRKHKREYMDLDKLVEGGMMTAEIAGVLCDSIAWRNNILISGATGSGKTTLADALAHRIPLDQRVIVIEDTTEIVLPHPNQRRFEAQQETEKGGAITIQRLVKAALRHTPDRLILGEIRGAEAYDLLQLLNTGHDGSICTLHASSSRRALRRLESCVALAGMEKGVEIPLKPIRRDIADSIDLVVHLEVKRVGEQEVRRVVREVLQVDGYDVASDEYKLEEVLHED